MATCTVTFQVEADHTTWGDVIALVGNMPALSSWGTQSAPVPLQPYPFPVWTTTLTLPCNTCLEYKYVIVRHGAIHHWEHFDAHDEARSDNRTLKTPSTPMDIHIRDGRMGILRDDDAVTFSSPHATPPAIDGERALGDNGVDSGRHGIVETVQELNDSVSCIRDSDSDHAVDAPSPLESPSSSSLSDPSLSSPQHSKQFTAATDMATREIASLPSLSSGKLTQLSSVTSSRSTRDTPALIHTPTSSHSVEDDSQPIATSSSSTESVNAKGESNYNAHDMTVVKTGKEDMSNNGMLQSLDEAQRQVDALRAMIALLRPVVATRVKGGDVSSSVGKVQVMGDVEPVSDGEGDGGRMGLRVKGRVDVSRGKEEEVMTMEALRMAQRSVNEAFEYVARLRELVEAGGGKRRMVIGGNEGEGNDGEDGGRNVVDVDVAIDRDGVATERAGTDVETEMADNVIGSKQAEPFTPKVDTTSGDENITPVQGQAAANVDAATTSVALGVGMVGVVTTLIGGASVGRVVLAAFDSCATGGAGGGWWRCMGDGLLRVVGEDGKRGGALVACVGMLTVGGMGLVLRGRRRFAMAMKG